jgi:hypothetical protein
MMRTVFIRLLSAEKFSPPPSSPDSLVSLPWSAAKIEKTP